VSELTSSEMATWSPAFARYVLDNRLRRLAESSRGQRGDKLAKAASLSRQLVEVGKLTAQEARDLVSKAGRHCGLDESEIDRAIGVEIKAEPESVSQPNIPSPPTASKNPVAGVRKIDRAVAFLTELLASNGRLESAEVFKRGNDAGFSRRTLERAKSTLGVEAIRMRTGDPTAPWLWHLATWQSGEKHPNNPEKSPQCHIATLPNDIEGQSDRNDEEV